MYKTIRHGENSLQYTILPQNDDFRLDGKLTSSTSNNTGHKITKRGRKRSFFAYLGLIFVCTVIIGAILIPFLVSAECLPSPSDWFLKAKVVFTKHDNNNNNNNANNNKNNNKTESTIKAYLDSNKHRSNHQTEQQVNIDETTNTPATTVKDDLNRNSLILTSLSSSSSDSSNDYMYTSHPISKSIRKKVLNPDHYNIFPTDEGIIDDIDNDVQTSYINSVKDHDKNDEKKITTAKTMMKNSIKMTTKIMKKSKRTTTLAPIETTALPLSTLSSVVSSNNKDTTEVLTSTKFNSQTMTGNYGSESSMTMIKISTKKPIILPVLAKTNSVIRENGKFIDDDNVENKNWIRSHWPFVDPSTYFQWAGVKSEDSVLLPAILGLALVGLILIIALCLVVRHKNKIVSSVRNRNRNITEETGEDNTTLLTTGNTSDDD